VEQRVHLVDDRHAWDFQYNELSFYIVPETYFYIPTFRSSFNQTATPVKLHQDFWSWSLPERRAWFLKEVMVNYLPKEVLPGDLLAGARFNVMISHCLTEKETREYDKLVKGKGGAREAMLWFHNHGYGNAGATSGHLVPDYARVLREVGKPSTPRSKSITTSSAVRKERCQRRPTARHDDRLYAGARPGWQVPPEAAHPGRKRK
jgi:hypothetical protein